MSDQPSVMTRKDRKKGEGRDIALIGAPIDVGAGVAGARMGPDALRVAGLAQRLTKLGHQVADWGNVTPLATSAMEPIQLAGNARNASDIAGWMRALSNRSFEAMQAAVTPIFMGGDHSMAMGSLNGVSRYWQQQQQELIVVWIDAHADFNTPQTSPSGNMHGMPMALLCGEPGMEAILGANGLFPVKPENVYMIGIRSIDQGERALLRERGVTVFDMRVIDEFGVSQLISRILSHAGRIGAQLHVSLDVDGLDPSIAPGVGTTVPGGITYREAHLMMEMLHDSGLVHSVDIAELNPFLDERGKSAQVLVELIGSLFGQQIFDRPPRHH